MKASVSDQNNLIELQRIDSAIMQATHKLKTLPEREQLTAIHTRLAASAELLATAEAELDLSRSDPRQPDGSDAEDAVRDADLPRPPGSQAKGAAAPVTGSLG
jgi:hypothetical protein